MKRRSFIKKGLVTAAAPLIGSGLIAKSRSEKIVFDQPESHFWWLDEDYKFYLNEFIKPPEYEQRIKKGLLIMTTRVSTSKTASRKGR